MHGVIVKKDGEKVEISIGEKEGDPVFCVTDLLPHLAAKQNDRKLAEGIKGEELNIVVGSVPFQDEDVKEPVKLLALQILNEMYGITEHDFYRAEIEMVPAHKAADVGFDRSMVGAYGQDDRVCAYTALLAEIETKKPARTTVTILADKEEIGSNGNTGLDSDYVLHYIEDLADQAGVKARDVLRNSLCLSSDVNAAYDPTFSDVYEARNSSYINKGCVLTKYTGGKRKVRLQRRQRRDHGQGDRNHGLRGRLLAGGRAGRGGRGRRRNHRQICGRNGCGYCGSGRADPVHARAL